MLIGSMQKKPPKRMWFEGTKWMRSWRSMTRRCPCVIVAMSWHCETEICTSTNLLWSWKTLSEGLAVSSTNLLLRLLLITIMAGQAWNQNDVIAIKWWMLHFKWKMASRAVVQIKFIGMPRLLSNIFWSCLFNSFHPWQPFPFPFSSLPFLNQCLTQWMHAQNDWQKKQENFLFGKWTCWLDQCKPNHQRGCGLRGPCECGREDWWWADVRELSLPCHGTAKQRSVQAKISSDPRSHFLKDLPCWHNETSDTDHSKLNWSRFLDDTIAATYKEILETLKV